MDEFDEFLESIGSVDPFQSISVRAEGLKEAVQVFKDPLGVSYRCRRVRWVTVIHGYPICKWVITCYNPKNIQNLRSYFPNDGNGIRLGLMGYYELWRD